MRTLRFEKDESSQKRFEVIFHGLIVTGNQNTSKGLSVLNREISLLDKLEIISKPCECGRKLPGLDEPDRELDFTNQDYLEFKIEDTEFDLLFDYICRVPWSIGAPSRLALNTLNWMKMTGSTNGSSSR